MDYPESTTWYVKASSNAAGPFSCGSAVAVRLKRKDTLNTARTYLLTCAHVIRRESRTQGMLGPRHTQIHVWKAGVGFDADEGIAVTPVEKVIPVSRVFDRVNFYNLEINAFAEPDWVLLEFENSKYDSRSDDVVHAWGNASDGDSYVICGYPDGERPFAGYDDGRINMVHPKGPYGVVGFRSVSNSIVQFQGGGTRNGMSGGGAFRKNSSDFTFVGLHRARDDHGLQLHAISAESIRRCLEDCDYEIVERESPNVATAQQGLQQEISDIWYRLLDPANDNEDLIESLIDEINALLEQNPKHPDLLVLHRKALKAKKRAGANFEWASARRMVSENLTRVQFVASTLLVILVATSVWWAVPVLLQPPDPAIAKIKKAVPTDAAPHLVPGFSQLEGKYESNLYLVVTEPFANRLTAPVFLLYSTDPSDLLEARGIIEEAESGAFKGNLIFDPPGRPSDSIRISLEGHAIEKGQQLRILIGAKQVLPHKEFLNTIKLERLE